jgi:hypothetical protein
MTVHAFGGIVPSHVRRELASGPHSVVRIGVFLGETLLVFFSTDELERLLGVPMHELARPLFKLEAGKLAEANATCPHFSPVPVAEANPQPEFSVFSISRTVA